MNSQINTTGLAFLLALQDLDTPLNDIEKQILKEVADQLYAQPLAWSSVTEPLLLRMIASNEPLNQLYQLYKPQLDSIEDFPNELLPTTTEIEQLSRDETVATRGLPPQSIPTGYKQQINNLVIVISRSEDPKEAIKKLSFPEKVKQFFGLETH
ncbi:hypothetical protein ACE1CI_36745 [Aerosakkonemataceae cyanobacterium BLCC-F50]|uniref:Uncharacterized protein n=1 Tax=Floridaenema flaviceps BLCC-F50 TaxID=3153642 RepID=A0ABV4Y482_9CYAN